MGVADKDDWIRWLGFSLFFGAGAVIVSTVFFVAFAANSNSKWVDLASYIFVVPLLPGWGFVAIFFNAWQAIHEGQIALVPIVSVPVDSAIIFMIWHYCARRRRTDGPEKHITLHLTQ